MVGVRSDMRREIGARQTGGGYVSILSLTRLEWRQQNAARKLGTATECDLQDTAENFVQNIAANSHSQ